MDFKKTCYLHPAQGTISRSTGTRCNLHQHTRQKQHHIEREQQGLQRTPVPNESDGYDKYPRLVNLRFIDSKSCFAPCSRRTSPSRHASPQQVSADTTKHTQFRRSPRASEQCLSHLIIQHIPYPVRSQYQKFIGMASPHASYVGRWRDDLLAWLSAIPPYNRTKWREANGCCVQLVECNIHFVRMFRCQVLCGGEMRSNSRRRKIE